MSSLIHSIMTTATNPSNWSHTLDEFNQIFELPSSSILSFNSVSNSKKNIFVSSFLRQNLTPELFDYIASNNDTVAYQALLKMNAQTLYREDTIINGGDNQDSSDIAIDEVSCISNQEMESLNNLPESRLRNIMSKQGITIRIASKLNLNGPWMDGFFIHTKNLQQGNRIVANNGINQLLPIIAGSIELGRCFEALRQRFNAALSVLDHLGLGVFLINPQGDIINKNNEAQRIIDLADGLNISQNGKLKTKSSDCQAQLDSLIGQANGVFQGNKIKFSELVSIPRPSRKFDFLVTVKPMLDSLGELEQNLGCAFVSIIDPCREDSLSIDGLVSLGQLSVAESKVVELIVNGYKIEEVAGRRGVSPNTVKTQLKAISNKLYCSTQGDIIRAAAATNIPIKN